MRNRTQAILIVDDDDATRGAIVRVLRACFPGIELREATNGDEALDLLQEDVVCVISDIDMPVRDGFALCWSIRNAVPYVPFKQVPVILVSALYQDEEAVLRAWQAGTALLLPKPFRIPELSRMIARLTGVAPTAYPTGPRRSAVLALPAAR